MEDRDYSNQLVSRMIIDACRLMFIWIKRRRNILDKKSKPTGV